MVGVGAGSEEWRELDSPRERDEPNPVILLRAPEILHLAPLMLTLFTLTLSHTFLLGFPLDFGSSLIARKLSLSFLCCKITHTHGGTTFG